MSDWRRSVWWSPARVYTMLGFCLLAFSLWIPWLSASRTTRVELRADGLASCLLEAAMVFDTPIEDADEQAIMARFLRLAAARELRINHIERVEPAPEGAILCVTNKHYALQLSLSPPNSQQRPGKHSVPALEVTAWPLSRVGPGHCAFFYPENGARAYTRNLRAGYAGLDENRPVPGKCHRRPGLGSKKTTQYVGDDNERWILY